MPTYMLLIIEPPAQRATRTEAQGREAYARMQGFGEDLGQQGKLLAVESLASQASAVRVTGVDTNCRVLDGPFSEAKEMIGGFFMIDCAGLDEAVADGGSPGYARQLNGPRWRCAPSRRVSTIATLDLATRVCTEAGAVEKAGLFRRTF
jgi:hypothetical protein